MHLLLQVLCSKRGPEVQSSTSLRLDKFCWVYTCFHQDQILFRSQTGYYIVPVVKGLRLRTNDGLQENVKDEWEELAYAVLPALRFTSFSLMSNSMRRGIWIQSTMVTLKFSKNPFVSYRYVYFFMTMDIFWKLLAVTGCSLDIC